MQTIGWQGVAKRVYEYCGLDYLTNLSTLQSKMTPRLKELGCTPTQYLERLQAHPQEWEQVVELLTINETYFFREDSQLNVLKSLILPQWQQNAEQGRRYRIWSAACSTGEEPYSLAMTIDEAGIIDPERVEIIASDINKKVLRHAMRGWYSKRSLSFRRIAPYLLSKYFHEEEAGYQVDEKIRKRVQFRNVNLLDSGQVALIGEMDVIFCRNVMIYFDAVTKSKVIQRFHQKLHGDGYLFLGHAESLAGMKSGFQSVHGFQTFYYRKEEPQDGAIRSIDR